MHYNIQKADDIYADIISIDNLYTVKQILSDKQNGQGKVFLVVKNNQWFAAKIFLRQVDFKAQIIFLEKLKQYKEIMKIYYSNVSAKLLRQNNQEAVMPVIIMQYFERGDLCDFLYEAYIYNKKYNKSIYTIPFRVSKTLFYDILLGLKNIHKAGILHKDLKPQNIMMDFSFRARIIDFGLSGYIGQKYIGNIKIGTRQYRAPEAQNQDQEKQFLPSSDLFVAGIIFYYMCFTGLPFLTTIDQNYKRFGISNKIGLKKYWESLSDQKSLIIPEDIKYFFSQIFLLDPKQRPTIEQILNSKMMQDRANAEEVIKQMKNQYEKFTEQSKKLYRILQLKNKLKQAQKISQINIGNVQINQQNLEDQQFRIIPPKESFFKQLLSKYQVQPVIEKKKLQLSQNIYEKFCFQSSPSFILAWIQYFLQISKENNSLRIINFLDNYKFVKFFTYLMQECPIICIQIKFQSSEQQVFVYSLKGKLLRRISDEKIIMEWRKQQDDLICHIFQKDLKQAMQALFYYEVQQQKQL